MARRAQSRTALPSAHEEQLSKQMEFKSWAGRHDANMQAFLRAMLTQLTPEVKASWSRKAPAPS